MRVLIIKIVTSLSRILNASPRNHAKGTHEARSDGSGRFVSAQIAGAGPHCIMFRALLRSGTIRIRMRSIVR